MREPKPLSRERMAEIATAYRSAIRDADVDRLCHPLDPYRVVTDLLAAEAFWREAVKRIAPWDKNGFCMLCDSVATWDTEKHKPGCPWRLAQD